LAYTESPGRSDNALEYWPAGEEGAPDFPRPDALPLGQAGVENYHGQPLDILGDVVSHKMVKDDPPTADIYQKFQGSMQPWQRKILHEQYAYARQNEGEQRPFEQWQETTGMPAYLRGYTFNQWPEAATKEMYTPEQRSLLDALRSYLGVGQTGPR
jgi:hypothetical protein